MTIFFLLLLFFFSLLILLIALLQHLHGSQWSRRQFFNEDNFFFSYFIDRFFAAFTWFTMK